MIDCWKWKTAKQLLGLSQFFVGAKGKNDDVWFRGNGLDRLFVFFLEG